jgi:hypothetical protein
MHQVNKWIRFSCYLPLLTLGTCCGHLIYYLLVGHIFFPRFVFTVSMSALIELLKVVALLIARKFPKYENTGNFWTSLSGKIMIQVYMAYICLFLASL